MSTPQLTPDDFAGFFRAVHDGNAPFPWQERLARHVFERGWPKALDVPTGAGKTASIDVAVFHLALEATKGVNRRAPIRIVFVVDRRLVVDEAHLQAMKIKSELEKATDGVLGRVKARLTLLAEPGRPALAAVKLRGGAPKEPDWIRTPAQPAVISSTVDQVGSRLFFRGYGVSDSMKPVHAGLLGSDALYLLDEAHLSQPFVQSIRDSRAFQTSKTWSDDAAPAPFEIVTLSATQKDEAPVLLKSDDRRHPVLGRRLAAQKPTQIVLTMDTAGSKAWVDECIARTWAMSVLGGGDGRTIAVVVNRIGRARAIHQELEKKLNGSLGADVALLIGPARPLDRDSKLQDLIPRLSARREEAVNARPLFVVATQCIEAGADFDFDAMLTELAPLDCLRQRLGRVNRTGRPINARGVVLASAEQVGANAEDPIYGGSPAATWALLSEKASTRGKGKAKEQWIDFGIEHAGEWLPEKGSLDPYLAPHESAPVMMPAFVEQWASTSPIPAADPEVSLFLHGPRAGPADVQVVWRADLHEHAESVWSERVAVCPPSALEAIAVPFYSARTWLLSEKQEDIADVELTSPSGARRPIDGGRRALRWRGPDDDQTEPIGPSQVRPADLLVVPAEYGGCDAWGWSPGARGPVTPDLGTEANRRHRGLEILRFTPEIVAQAWREQGGDEADSDLHAARLRELIETLRDESDREVVRTFSSNESIPFRWRESLRSSNSKLHRDEQGNPLALIRRVRSDEPTGTASTEDELSSRSFKAIPLAKHSCGVRDVAKQFAEQLGLPN